MVAIDFELQCGHARHIGGAQGLEIAGVPRFHGRGRAGARRKHNALATGIDFFILLVFYVVSTLILEVDPEARDPRANAGSLYVWGILIAAFWVALTLW